MINVDLWLHGSSESDSEILRKAGLSDYARDTFGRPTYEVQMNFDIDPVTGAYKIMYIKADGKTFVEQS